MQSSVAEKILSQGVMASEGLVSKAEKCEEEPKSVKKSKTGFEL